MDRTQVIFVLVVVAAFEATCSHSQHQSPSETSAAIAPNFASATPNASPAYMADCPGHVRLADGEIVLAPPNVLEKLQSEHVKVPDYCPSPAPSQLGDAGTQNQFVPPNAHVSHRSYLPGIYFKACTLAYEKLRSMKQSPLKNVDLSNLTIEIGDEPDIHLLQITFMPLGFRSNSRLSLAQKEVNFNVDTRTYIVSGPMNF